MIRIAILDDEGNMMTAKDVPTAAELRVLADQARNIIRECETLALQKGPRAQGAPGAPEQAPYGG